MKKTIILFVLMISGIVLSGCDMIPSNVDVKDDEVIDIIEDINNQKEDNYEKCGEGEFVVVNDVCYPVGSLFSESVTVYNDYTINNMADGIELLNDYVADLSNSTGIAVVPSNVYLSNQNPSNQRKNANDETDDENQESSENVLVKLTEEGFFEEVSFTNQYGDIVNVLSNPLALEVYGPFTVVIFETSSNPQMEGEPVDFASQMYNSLYSGGVYLIHNETGKLFATKDVVQKEDSYTEDKYYSEVINIVVTLNEPVVYNIEMQVFDELGNPVYDAEGYEVFESQEFELEDSDGNPLIFTEGIIKTEIEQIPLFEYKEEPMLDEEGNEVLDEEGNPIMEKVEYPMIDAEGNQMYEEIIVPVLDAEGNPIFETEMEVELYVEQVQQITHINVYSEITDNPLSTLAAKFVENILQDYYNWNYYRVDNNVLQYNSFVYNVDSIFYQSELYSEGKMESMIKKLSFDFDTNEVILEDYFNATKAGFTNCEILYDQDANLFICREYNENIKVFSRETGLLTIPDTSSLELIKMPNGELFFYDMQEQFVEELGYSTTLLYQIDETGTLSESYIELGETIQTAYGNYQDNVSVGVLNTINETGKYYMQIEYNQGDYVLESMLLEQGTIGEYSSTRPTCDDQYGCYYNVSVEILDELGEEVVEMEQGYHIYPGEEVPSFKTVYQYNDNTRLVYAEEYVEIINVCENELGCVNSIWIQDPEAGQNGLSITDSFLVEQGAMLINSFTIVDNATYYDSIELSDVTCEYDYCYVDVPVKVYNMQNELVGDSIGWLTIEKDEVIPFEIVYRMTDNTTIVYETNVCADADGCTREYYLEDGYNIELEFEHNDLYISYIEFAASDKEEVTTTILESEVCEDFNGCNQDYVTFRILDDNQEILYEFRNNVWVEFGYEQAYLVEVSIHDVEINYNITYDEQEMVCETSTCRYNVEFMLENDIDTTSLGWREMVFEEGEKVLRQVVLTSDSLIDETVDYVCNQEDGCETWTNNFEVIDQDGNVVEFFTDEWTNHSMPVSFAYGELLPTTNDFFVTYNVTEVEYRSQRANIYDFIYELQNAVELDENTYFIERSQWQQGTFNFILTFNEESGRYHLSYTNLNSMDDITKFNDSFIAVNDSKTAIYKLLLVDRLSTEDFYYFDQINLTEGELINQVKDLFVDYAGTVYFTGIDNQIQDITGSILEDGTVIIDTEFVEHEVIRVRPIN